MRIQLMVLVAVVSIALIGCGKKKEVVVKYPPGSSPSGESKKAAPPLGRSGGPPPAQEEEEAGNDANNDAGEAPTAKKQEPVTAGARSVAPPRRRSAFSSQRARQRAASSSDNSATADTGETTTPTSDAPPAGDDNTSTVSTNPTATPDETSTKTDRKSFHDRATVAFKNDHDNEAFQFLYGHALTEDGALKDHPINWYPGVAEPRLALRWGVGVDYNKGRFDGDPPVIGDPVGDSSASSSAPNSDTGTGPPGGGARGIGGARRPRTGFSNRNRNQQTQSTPAKRFEDPAEELEYYTGDFGDKFIERIEMRRKRGFYGAALQNIDLNQSFANADDSSSSAASSGPPLDGGGDFALAGAGRRRPPRNTQNQGSGDDEPTYEAERTSLAPGLMMLGTGTQKSLIEDAQENNLDLLVVFSVKVDHSESRNSTKSKTQARLINVKSGEVLKVSKTLTNTSVAKARESGAEDDPVEVALDQIFKEMSDQDYKAVDMPEIEAQYIKQRVNELVDSKPDNPLPQMVEIKFYHVNGTISRDEFITAIEGMIGPDNAKKLIDGDIDDRESAIAQWMPGKFDSGSSFR